ncbi:hypothetical protein SAY87_016638 [Trapa incisa]|uniref:Hydroxyproline-rich glycoprotein family protein n=1 Tax=Trapa incisa TaxID=236973 RepID=A0AAN7LHW1_9MYRT|nr:hypothetical protein SAY87_016638 [Trapa incisa]
MPSGNVGISDGKNKFQADVGSGDVRHGHQPPVLFQDERDGFISWLRGEFAAANAIIDGLCHHLRAVGEPGEYDFLIGLIQQRRCNWTPVLHMQQYFPVSEILYALNQVMRTRQLQQPKFYDHSKLGDKEFRRTGPGFSKNQGQKGGEAVKEVLNSGFDGSNNNGTDPKGKKWKVSTKPDDATNDEKVVAKSLTEYNLKSPKTYEQISSGNSKSDSGLPNESCMSISKEVEEDIPNQNRKQHHLSTPKSFVGNEISDGRMVNVVDGMKLYENLLEDAKVKRLISLVTDLRAAGKKQQFRGKTYSISKRPMKGRGREIIQLGLPVANGPLEDEKDRIIEAIPALLQEVIEYIVDMNIMTLKPDSCIIDIYYEGDYSQPCLWPHWFERPFCLLSLTECNVTFGKVIAIDNPENFKGSLKLSLAPGSLLMMQGKSADIAKYSLPSLRKQRILITFAKSQPKKSISIDNQLHITSPAIIQSSLQGAAPNRPINYISNPAGFKYYGSVPSKNIFPAAAIIPAINGMQQLLVAAPSMPFPTSVPIPLTSTTRWAAVPPRNQPPHPNIPGTGVFLPPGSVNPSSPALLSLSTTIEQNPNGNSIWEYGTEKSNQGNADCNCDIVEGKTIMKKEHEGGEQSH